VSGSALSKITKVHSASASARAFSKQALKWSPATNQVHVRYRGCALLLSRAQLRCIAYSSCARALYSATIAQAVPRTGRPKSVLQDGALSANAHLNGERLGRCGLLEHWILLCAAKGVAGCPPNGPVCHARARLCRNWRSWLTIHSWYTGTCSSRYGTSTRRSPVSVRSVLISIVAQQPPAGRPVAACYAPRHDL